LKKLTGKIALVTGAAQGIGQAIAIALAKEGAHVMLCDIASCAKTVSGMQKEGQGGSYSEFLVDMSAKETPLHLAQEGRRLGGIDILVNNAAIAVPRPFLDIEETLWQQTLLLNLQSPALLCQAIIPQMQEKGQGIIINMASDLGISGHPLLAPYSASKAALIALTRSLALAFSPLIRVNAIAPGPIDTPLLEQLGVPKEMLARSLPAKRLGTPEEVAATALFLPLMPLLFITDRCFAPMAAVSCPKFAAVL